MTSSKKNFVLNKFNLTCIIFSTPIFISFIFFSFLLKYISSHITFFSGFKKEISISFSIKGGELVLLVLIINYCLYEISNLN